MDDLKRLHKALVESAESQAEAKKEIQLEVDELSEKNSLYIQIVKIVRADRIRPDLFRALAEAGAYRGIPADNIQKVVQVLTDFLSRPDVSAPFMDKGGAVVHTVEEVPYLSDLGADHVEVEIPGSYVEKDPEDDILFF